MTTERLDGWEAAGAPGAAAVEGRRVLVTGATGFIGRHLVAGLLRDGWRVAAFVRGESGASIPPAPGLHAVRGDLTDPATVDRAVAEADAVCHLAAFIPADMEDGGAAGACLETNALAALRVAEAAARRAARVVFFSTGQVCGPSAEALAEDAPAYPSGRATYYLASKLAGELFVEHARLARGLPAVTLRVGSCYGPGMPEKSVVARFMAAARAGSRLEVWGGGAARYDFVHVDDVVWLARTALRGGPPGVYNAGSGRGSTVPELARAVAEVCADRRVEVCVRPDAAAPAPGFAPLSTEKAFKAWGYRPRGLEAGLSEYRRRLEEKDADRRL